MGRRPLDVIQSAFTSPTDAARAGEEYALAPTDWQRLIREGLPEIDYLDPPYFPRGARIWIWGATGASKSIYALWEACHLSRAGHAVSYFSEENPQAEDLRRLSLLAPDPEHFTYYYRTGMDLSDERWVAAMLAVTNGAEAVFFDTWTDLWHGDENSNEDVRDFDAGVLKPLQAQGATPVLVHHTGHPQMFSARKGATAGRGASSLGQKADVTLEFRAGEDREFTIVYGKSRIGGEWQPDRAFRVVDLEEPPGLDIVEVESGGMRAVAALAEKMAQAILTAPKGRLTTSELRVAVGGARDTQRGALEVLERDPRVRTVLRKLETADGRKRDAKVWEAVGGVVQGLLT